MVVLMESLLSGHETKHPLSDDMLLARLEFTECPAEGFPCNLRQLSRREIEQMADVLLGCLVGICCMQGTGIGSGNGAVGCMELAPCWSDQWDTVATSGSYLCIVFRGKLISNMVQVVLDWEKVERCGLMLVAAKVMWNERSGDQWKSEYNTMF